MNIVNYYMFILINYMLCEYCELSVYCDSKV